MWTFQLLPEVKRIFAKPGYPKHYPNTVVPGYAVAVQAKYEVTQMSVLENPFKTKYFCWLDMGYFRDIASVPTNHSTFSIYLPRGFQEDSVAYQEVYNRRKEVGIREIFNQNIDWLAGGFFIAQAQIMYEWTKEHQVPMTYLYCYEIIGRGSRMED
jgi:Bacterial protein of unknown function (HtrL_YibB)